MVIMIIGISSKYDFGRWNHSAYAFETAEAADKWLHTEEYDFRERELFEDSRIKEAMKLAGVENVTSAVYRLLYDREPTEAELWKELRKAYGLTQEEMARATGIGIRTIQNWETGHRSAPEYMIGLVECKLSENDLEWYENKKSED